MTMDRAHIIDIVTPFYPKVTPEQVTPLTGGFSSQAYKIDAPEPFVLLVERPGAVSASGYGQGYVVLKLLQKHGIGHAPRALWLKEDHTALALSFAPGTPSDTFDFAATDIDTEQLAIEVIDALFDAAVITLEEYRELATEVGIEPMPISTQAAMAETYGTGWLEIVQASCPDSDIVAWLEPRVRHAVAIASQFDKPPTFGHSDPSNPNILINADGSFTLIDWDTARFSTSGPECYVAYTTHLTDFMRPHRQALIKHVAKRFDIPVETFAAQVEAYRRYNEVFDVNWAAMMMAKAAAGTIEDDVDYFRHIARERIRIYEDSFGTDVPDVE
jgi:hypothetical protein